MPPMPFKRRPPATIVDFPLPSPAPSPPPEHPAVTLSGQRSFHARSPTTMSASSSYFTLPRRTVTSDLSDFLRDTGPPPTPSLSPSTKKSRFFSTKSKKEKERDKLPMQVSPQRRLTATSYMSASSALSAVSTTTSKTFENGSAILMINAEPSSARTSLSTTRSLRSPKPPSEHIRHRPLTAPTNSPPRIAHKKSFAADHSPRALSPIDASTTDSDVGYYTDPRKDKDDRYHEVTRRVSQSSTLRDSQMHTPVRTRTSRDSMAGSVRTTHSSVHSTAPTISLPRYSPPSAVSVTHRPATSPTASVPRRTFKVSRPTYPEEADGNLLSTPPHTYGFTSNGPHSGYASPPSTASPTTPKSPDLHLSLHPHSVPFVTSPNGNHPSFLHSDPTIPKSPIDYRGYKFPVPPLTSSPSGSTSSDPMDGHDLRRGHLERFAGASEGDDSDGDPSIIHHGEDRHTLGEDPTESMIDLDQQIEEVLNLNLKYQNLASQGRGTGRGTDSERRMVSDSTVQSYTPSKKFTESPKRRKKRSGGRHSSGSSSATRDRSSLDTTSPPEVHSALPAHITMPPSARSSLSSARNPPVFMTPGYVPPHTSHGPPPRMPLPPSPTSTPPTLFNSMALGSPSTTSPAMVAVALAGTNSSIPSVLSGTASSPQAQVTSLTYALHTQRSRFESLSAQVIHASAQWEDERSTYERRISELEAEVMKQVDTVSLLQYQQENGLPPRLEKSQQTSPVVASVELTDMERECYEKKIEEQERRVEEVEKMLAMYEQEKYAWERERKGLRWLVEQHGKSFGLSNLPSENGSVVVEEQPAPIVAKRPVVYRSATATIPLPLLLSTKATVKGTGNPGKRDGAYPSLTASSKTTPPTPPYATSRRPHTAAPAGLHSSSMSRESSSRASMDGSLLLAPSVFKDGKTLKRNSVHITDFESFALGYAPGQRRSPRPLSAAMDEMLEKLRKLGNEAATVVEDARSIEESRSVGLSESASSVDSQTDGEADTTVVLPPTKAHETLA